MKKIVIFADEFIPNPINPAMRGTTKRKFLRVIRPSALFQGYYKNGSVNDREIRNLAGSLEPSFTGYAIS